MAAPPYHGFEPAFPDTSFDPTNFGRSSQAPGPSVTDPHTIDFDASQTYFDGLQSPGSPWDHQHVPNDHPPDQSPYHSAHLSTQGLRHGHDTSQISPRPAVSGLDPISKLGFTSNRASPQSHFGNNGVGHVQAPLQTYFPNQPFMQPQPLQHSQHPHSPTHAPQVGHARLSQERRPSYTVQQRNDDAAHRAAEVERRNRLREEEKARRTMAIQKQVDDGMAALKLEKVDAAHRTAEAERRNKQREQEKERRRLAIEKQVADGIKAIQLEKERECARAQEDRKACRKWLSDLAPATASISASTPFSTAADQVTDTIDLYVAIGRQLRGFWQESRPAASSQQHRNEVIADVQQAINRKWPGQGLQVAAFGSSVTGLVTDSSDLDLVLLDPTRPYGAGTPPELRRNPHKFVRQSGGTPEWYSTNQVADAIRNSNKFRSIVPISGASVPIVKMIHKRYDIPADININERFGLFNSQLIQAYANLQPHIVRPLVFFLKHWYSRCDLNDPAGKRGSMTFSSYTIALMALQVLQIEGVLPNLQSPVLLNDLHIRPSFLYSRIKRPRRRGKNGRANEAEEVSTPQKYNVTFATGDVNMEPYKPRAPELTADGATTNGTSTTSSAPSTDRLLGRMLVAFVRFYTELDRRTQVVSVVNGTPLQRKKGSHPRHLLFDSASEDDASPQDPLEPASRDAESRAALREEAKDIWAGEELVVQDPFIIDRNTSRNIKAAAITEWQTTMENALTHLGLQKGADVEQAPRVRLEDAPLILDLCLPSSLRSGTERNKAAAGTNEISAAGQATEAQRLEEEGGAQARHLAKQAAQNLRREKRKQARSLKQDEARRLQEEAAMVEDMIDGIHSGGTAVVSEVWRLRMDNVDSPGTRTGDGNKNKDLSVTPFTFSVTKSPAAAVPPIASASATADGEGAKQKSAGEVARPPTKTYGSAESEDIDLVALRMEQSARIFPA